MTNATIEDIFDTLEHLTEEDKAELYRSASRALGGTRFSGPADLFSQTIDRLLAGERHWPLEISFRDYMHMAMRSVGGADRHCHEVARMFRLPIDEISDHSGHAVLRSPSALDTLLRKEFVEQSLRAFEIAREWLREDDQALAVIDTWMESIEPAELRRRSKMSQGACDAARKRATRALRKARDERH